MGAVFSKGPVQKEGQDDTEESFCWRLLLADRLVEGGGTVCRLIGCFGFHKS